ncbi:tetratricopeptide repeat protein [bacterium]|nr:tetratricopeptide repeat protein [bacterium]
MIEREIAAGGFVKTRCVSNTLIRAGILISLFLAPICANCMDVWSDIAFMPLLLVLAIAWIKKEEGLKRTPIDRPVIFFMMAAIISTVLSVHIHSSINELIRLISYILLFYLVINLFESEEKTSALFLVISISGLFISLYGIYQYLFGFDHLARSLEVAKDLDPVMLITLQSRLNLGRAFSTFPTPNHLAGYLVMIIPVSLGLLLKKAYPRLAPLLIFTILINLACLFLTFSRGGWIVLASVIFFYGIFKTKRPWIFNSQRKMNMSGADFQIKREKPRLMPVLIKLSAGIFITLIISCSILILGPKNPEGLGHVMEILEKNPMEIESVKIRRSHWTGALRIIGENPLTGTGMGTFGVAYPKFSQNMEETKFAHCLPLQIGSEMGIPGLLAFLYLIFSLMKAVLCYSENRFSCLALPKSGMRLHQEKGKMYGGYTIFLLMGISAYLLHNLMDFEWYISGSTLVWWALAGAAINLKTIYKDKNQKEEDYYYEEGKNGMAMINEDQDNDECSDEYHDHEAWFVKKRGYAKSILIVFLLSVLLLKALHLWSSDFLEKGDRLVKTGDYENAVTFYIKAKRLDPMNDVCYSRLANTYARMAFNSPDKSSDLSLPFIDIAIKEFKRAISLSPRYFQYHVDLGDIYHAKGLISGAIDEYRKAISLYPGGSDIYMNIAWAYLEQGEYDLAKLECIKSLEIIPNNEDAKKILNIITKGI